VQNALIAKCEILLREEFPSRSATLILPVCPGAGTSVRAARTQSLMMPTRFQPGFHERQLLPEAGAFGTDRAFMGKYDGAGQVHTRQTIILAMSSC
jgi:hypothetical protein